MSVYLDASVLISLFTEDAFSNRADGFVRSGHSAIIVSDFASAEFSSVISRNTRMAKLSTQRAREIFSDFDRWTASTLRVECTASDVQEAISVLRRLDLNLRAPDAIHIAIARRLGAELAIFDTRISECARALGASVTAL